MSSSHWTVLEGDCRTVLAGLPEKSVQTCVTSPPYFGLRDYGHDGQIGAERHVIQYVEALKDVFQSVGRVLRDDGTLWLNLGDSYDKDKSLLGVPWKVAQRLRHEGWLIRSDIIWAKPNPMPESVTDRPTKAHEYLFLLSKQPRYFYDADAIREEHGDSNTSRLAALREHGDGATGEWIPGSAQEDDPHRSQLDHRGLPGVGTTFGKFNSEGRNKRSVWTVATQPYAGAHFATFPPKLIEPCVLAGSRPGDTVLDPFAGAGTTGVVALRHDRSFVGIELNPTYAAMARDRIRDDAPLLNTPLEKAA